MEENDQNHREVEQQQQQQQQQEAGEESNRGILPLLQAPGNHQPHHRITNFFIDNILRPEFGRRKEGAVQQEDLFSGRDSVLARSGAETGQHRSSTGGTEAEGAPKAITGDKKIDVGIEGPIKPRGGLSADHSLSSDSDSSQASSTNNQQPMLWPAWVYCTRYSDRPSSGPRSRKPKKKTVTKEDKRPRTAFTAEQLQRLKAEFQTNRYLTEQRRQSLAQELNLNESQIKIWFQNKRAKIKKATGNKNTLALHLMAQGLYNHSTTSKDSKSDSE